MACGWALRYHQPTAGATRIFLHVARVSDGENREPANRELRALQLPLQKRDDLLPPLRRLLVTDVVAEQLPSLGMSEAGVDALQFGVDDVEALDRRELVLQPGECRGARAAR